MAVVVTGPDREGAEPAAVRLLRESLGAKVLFGPPAPFDDTPPHARFLAPAAFTVACCGHGHPGAGECGDCPNARPRFLAPRPGEPCTVVGCGGRCGWPEDEHDTITYIAPNQADADRARATFEAGKAALAGAVCVRSSGPLTDADVRAVGEFAQQLAIPAAPLFGAPAADPSRARYSDDLWQELTQAVRRYAAADPRSLQVEIGPSEIGHPCDARVLRTALGVDRFNVDSDPWASFVGQAVHAKLADVFDWCNRRLGIERYFVERKVYLSDGIYGSCDLFRDGIVIDHKIMGATSMKELERLQLDAKGGIYRTQVHGYGKGWHRAGVPVTEVAIAAWPRSGFLDGLRIYREPFDESIADRALDRLSALTAGAVTPDVDPDTDAFWETVPVKPSKQCGFCYWYDPNQDPNVPTVTRCGAGRDVRKSQP